jgi:hypothetical protein
MGPGKITGLLDGLKKAAAGPAGKRKASNGCKYGIQDFLFSAFAVFYFQHPPMLNFQEAMEKERKRNNLRALSGVEKIPGVDQIRNILDEIEPERLAGAFDTALGIAGEMGILEGYRVLNGMIPAALDGTRYFSSREIHCLRVEKKNRERDCERNAAKRRIKRHKERYGPLKITILGDDLYACHSICAPPAEAGMNFLLTLKTKPVRG